MGLRMWFLESCGDIPKKEVRTVRDCQQPFTCDFSIYCELEGRRWIECRKDGRKCRKSSTDWWETWLRREDKK